MTETKILKLGDLYGSRAFVWDVDWRGTSSNLGAVLPKMAFFKKIEIVVILKQIVTEFWEQ